MILSDHGLATTGDLNGIWGPDPANVFIGGQSGLLGHWNGTQFLGVPGTPAITIEEIHGTSATDFWVGGFSLAHFTGTWSPTESPPSGNNIEGLWASGGGELFIQTGESPWIRTATSDIDIGGPLPAELVLDVDGSSNSNVWFVADTSLYQFDDLYFTQHPVDVNDIWVLDEDEAWAVAGTSILRWDGVRWTPETTPPLPGTVTLRQIHGISASDISAFDEPAEQDRVEELERLPLVGVNESGRVYLEFADATPAEAARGMALITKLVG